MNFKLIVFLCFLSGCLAVRYQVLPDIFDTSIRPSPFNPLRPVPFERFRRRAPPYTLSGGGGSVAGGKYYLKADIAGPVWTSPNGQHTIGVSGGYTQGGGAPDYRAGVGYTFTF